MLIKKNGGVLILLPASFIFLLTSSFIIRDKKDNSGSESKKYTGVISYSPHLSETGSVSIWFSRTCPPVGAEEQSPQRLFFAAPFSLCTCCGKLFKLSGYPGINIINAAATPYHFSGENEKKINFIQHPLCKINYPMAHDNNTTPLYFNENQALTPGALAQLPSDTLLDQNVSQKITGNIFKFSLTGKKHPPVKLFGADNNNETGSKIAVLTMTVSFSGRILGLFDVYLNLPPGATPDTKGNYFAGFMSFFGSTGVHQFPVEKNTGAGNKKQTKTFYFDMTDEFMATKALEKNEFEITIIRHNTNRNEDITVERVTITTQMP